jgi:motility quorum-sensing regulator/GCU-specific mRNA interferase toxin
MIPKVKEKRKPHYMLSAFKALFRREATRSITVTAHKGAASEGYMAVEDIENVIDQLCSEHFYKSMTTHYNHKLWQDVYRYRKDDGTALYIKLQLSPDNEKAVLVQMKRDEGSDE